jgi:hypothetical protein
VAAAAALAAGGVAPGPPAAAQFPEQRFAAYGTGSAASLQALRTGETEGLNLQVGFAGHSVNGVGLGAPIFNELDIAVQPALPGSHAYGRGSGLEAGVLTAVQGVPNPNQVVLAGLADAAAPPPSEVVVREVGPLSLGGVAAASLLRGRAQASYGGGECAVGRPLGYGEGEAGTVQLLGTPGPGGELVAPLVGLALPPAGPEPRRAARTRSVAYLLPNGDGTFGVVSETRQTLAPVSLLGGLLTVEVLGEWALRAVATGQPGGARIEYAPLGAGPSTPVVRVNGIELTLQQLVGSGGQELDLSPLAVVRVGAPPRAIRGTGDPAVSTDGTAASAAVDAVRITVLALAPLGLRSAEIRLGHMEAAAFSPAGGVACGLPVGKALDRTELRPGQEFEATIRIPSDPDAFTARFDCDLAAVTAQDVTRTTGGDPRVALLSASHGGIVEEGGRVTWPDLGGYRRGGPPIVVTVRGRVEPGSGAGTIEDVVTVTARLAGCQGGAAGQDVVAAAVAGGRVVGDATVAAAVQRPQIPATGRGDGALAMGLGLSGAALALRRLREAHAQRRPEPAQPQGGGVGRRP